MLINTRAAAFLPKLIVCLGLLASIPIVALAQAQMVNQQEEFKEVRLANERFVRGAPIPEWVKPSTTIPESLDRSPAVLRLSETEFLASDSHSVFVRRVWKINDASGVEQLGHVPIVFRSDYQSVRLHALRVIRNLAVLDQTKSARLRFLQREAGLDQGLYNGEITASIVVDDLRVGDSLELAYTTDGQNPVFRGKFMDAAGWDSSIPVQMRRVTLHHSAGRPVRWRVIGDVEGKLPQPIEISNNNLRSFLWEQKALVTMVREPNTPYGYVPERYIQFSEFASWNDVSNWGAQLFKANKPPGDELGRLAHQFKGDTLEARVSEALTWVQSEIRYFSVSLGESSHQPASPDETLLRRWGDCKDKAFLLIELLRVMGVDARPALVSTRDRLGISKLLPTAFAFDHVIARVRVNSKDYFLDPTRQGQAGRLDRMGQAHEGLDVLVVSEETVGISSIQSANQAELNLDSLSERIKIEKLGGVGALEVVQSWVGITAENIRLALKRTPIDQIEKRLMSNYEQRYPGLAREKASLIQDDVSSNALTITSYYRSPKMSVEGNGEWGVRYAANNFQGMLIPPASPNRVHPVAISAGKQKAIYKVDVEFPKDVSVVSDPVTRAVKDANFEFSVTTSFRGNQASTTLTLEVLENHVQSGHVSRFMEAWRKTGDINRSVFVVSKSDLKAAGLFGVGNKTIQSTISERLAERVEKVTKALEGGQLKGDDLAFAHCDRAEARIEQGKSTEAMVDAQAAVKIAPNLPEAYECRASGWFSLDEYAKSITDYSKAISLGSKEMHPFYRRGHSKFYSGQLGAALEDFSQAVARGDGEGALYAELWRVWTQLRLGIKPNSERIALASKESMGEWPRPALAMLHELVSVEEALKSLENKKGDDREMALAEAYFYAGQYYFSKGDRVKAAEFFKKTRSQGITIYIEHIAAGKELRLMGIEP